MKGVVYFVKSTPQQHDFGLNPFSPFVKYIGTQKVKNVIFLIGDGMGFSYTTGLRYFNHDSQQGLMNPTIFDQFFVGSQSTYSLDTESNITDSAAAGTALSTGYKTYNGALGLNIDKQTVPTILEYAKFRGKSTGLVGTSQINHATLAAFASHIESREQYDQIADDYLDERIEGKQKIDVMLGGGTSYFVRKDRNLVEEFVKNQFGYVTNLQELLANKTEQLLGLFAPIELPKQIDRGLAVPSLAQMTKAALERLKQNSNGFFLLVEGSQIDWAGHDNDIVGAMSEVKDFEAAFKEAVKFALNRDDTIVIATADHSTGGMSIDRNDNYKWNPSVIKSITSTPFVIAERLHETKDMETLKHHMHFTLHEADLKIIQTTLELEVEDTKQALINIINHYSSTGWTTKGHTGEDVPIYAYGLNRHLFSGRMENSEIAKILFQIID
ncbi:alkaline phosphatase [Paenibacillus sp. BSR1-1]|uniref:alkaline phosphatase n=1 Tax=Paenibacillus sp. BSR1-1 TaxID=3020845 RepID=UPI0025AF7E58|nr:alkaline phosphatase [Paenibacillus sp. BSR1-1]MDN3020252.1 alkaline phosphatase [Paenibacillus sp. BSR1-1]